MKAKWNRNVVLNLMIAAGDGIANSIWAETMLVSFLSDLTNGACQNSRSQIPALLLILRRTVR